MLRPVPPGGLRAGQIALAAALLALVWHLVGGREALRSLASADAAWLAAAFAALILQTALSALRWQLTAGQLGIRLETPDALREYFLGQLVNQSLPGGVLGDARRAIRSRGDAGLLASGQAVIFERLAGQAGLFLCAAVAFALTFAVPGGVSWPAWLALPVAALLAAALGLPFALHAARRLGGRVGRTIEALWRPMITALAARDVIWRQVALSLATAACNLAAFAFCAEAVGHGLPPAAVAAFVPLVLMTMLVPLTISGWGLREGAAAALFPLAGSTASGGLAASVVFGLTMILAALPGILVLLRQRLTPLGTRGS